jgi:hypothetical protein
MSWWSQEVKSIWPYVLLSIFIAVAIIAGWLTYNSYSHGISIW